jgi:hypothetical protein
MEVVMTITPPWEAAHAACDIEHEQEEEHRERSKPTEMPEVRVSDEREAA